MTKQVILGRWEIPVDDLVSSDDIFREYKGMCRENNDGIIVRGLSVAISYGSPSRGNSRTVIILTHDEESEKYMKLKFMYRKDVFHRRIV